MPKINSRSNIFARYGVITLGCVIYAAAIALFLDPNSLAPGGVTGVAVIINSVSGVSTGTLILLFNIPLLIIGIWKFGGKFFLSTVYATALSSVMVNLLTPLGPLSNDLLLSACAGGALMALGMGLIFKVGATTGGTDIIVRLIKIRYKHMKTGKVFLMTDAFVIAAAALVFRDLDIALYAAIATIINSIVFDMVLYGSDSARLVYIITDHVDDVSGKILQLDIGVTLLEGTGAYTRSEKRVIMCAVRKQMLPTIQDLALEADAEAFMIVTSANEIYGEGFKSVHDDRL